MLRRRRIEEDADRPTQVLEPADVTREYVEERPAAPPPGPPPPVRRAWSDELAWALVALLILVLVGVGLWWYFSHRGSSTRSVPTVTGMTLGTAVNTLQSDGFRTQIVTAAHSGPPGVVYAEAPPAGTRAKKGSVVQVDVSKGPATVAVPNAVGLTEAAARDRLVAAGFTVTEARVFGGQAGTVTAQSPAAGSKAARGGTVRINVSKGSASVIVPNVVGMTLGVAETKIAEAGLKSVVQLHVPSAQPAGTVVAQNPPGGQAKRDSTVRLNVSNGSGSGTSGATGPSGVTGPTGTG